MIKNILLLISLLSSASTSFAQTLDSLKLNAIEIPAGYNKTDELVCATTYSSSFYNQTDLYESIVGKLIKKEYQSFNKKGDQGAILYFQFEKDFKAQSFLNGLLWGQEKKASKTVPDEYYAKGSILIIWSFNFKSTIKDISKTKVTGLLGVNDPMVKNKELMSDTKVGKDYLLANVKFINGDYKGCIPLYKNVMKQDTLLERTHWHVLIDNLGMAYGITGNLGMSEQTFKYGLSKDSIYPMFYYNLACTYAEKNDMNTSIEYLRSAFKYKQNMLSGETFPDPSKDDSFQRFMSNDKFVSVLKELNSLYIKNFTE